MVMFDSAHIGLLIGTVAFLAISTLVVSKLPRMGQNIAFFMAALYCAGGIFFRYGMNLSFAGGFNFKTLGTQMLQVCNFNFILVLLMLIPKYRKAGFSMGAALLMGLLLCNLTLKPLVARIRPYDYQLEHFNKVIPLLISAPHDFSFPSGHTIASFEAAVAMLICHKKLGIPAMILAVLIAFSRLYLYVHYPTDVIASVILGTGLALLSVFLVNKLWPRLKRKQNKA